MVHGLVHIDDDAPGISRRRAGRGWSYFQSDGSRITDRAEIDRLNGIALPPAYTDAWFCPRPDGHILARGKDAKGRRQYRYHPEFRAVNDARKFAQCVNFGEQLPKLRAQFVRDLQRRGLGHETVTAAVVRLLDETAIRVGTNAMPARIEAMAQQRFVNIMSKWMARPCKLPFAPSQARKRRLR